MSDDLERMLKDDERDLTAAAEKFKRQIEEAEELLSDRRYWLREVRANFPPELLAMRRWVGWRRVPDPDRPGKFKKPPCSAVTGEERGWTESGTTFDEAAEGIERLRLDGPGFILKDGDGLVGVDFDGAVTDGVPSPEVLALLNFLPSYTERSVSGSGLHVICRGTIPKSIPARAVSENSAATVEAYGGGRFFTCTGAPLSVDWEGHRAPHQGAGARAAGEGEGPCAAGDGEGRGVRRGDRRQEDRREVLLHQARRLRRRGVDEPRHRGGRRALGRHTRGGPAPLPRGRVQKIPGQVQRGGADEGAEGGDQCGFELRTQGRR
jgi:hypothetical protein